MQGTIIKKSYTQLNKYSKWYKVKITEKCSVLINNRVIYKLDYSHNNYGWNG